MLAMRTYPAIERMRTNASHTCKLTLSAIPSPGSLPCSCINNTFNIQGVQDHTMFFKTVEDAARLRLRVSECFERAALPQTTPEVRRTCDTMGISAADAPVGGMFRVAHMCSAWPRLCCCHLGCRLCAGGWHVPWRVRSGAQWRAWWRVQSAGCGGPCSDSLLATAPRRSAAGCCLL